MASLIDSSTGIVFCEGHAGGLDPIFISNILSPGTAFIRPVGGKYGMRAYIDGYLSGYTTGNEPKYIAFRDRDFDYEPPAKEKLIELGGEKPIYLSYCASIENYLIDSSLIRQYWAERQDAPKWGHGKAPSINEIEEKIIEAAIEIRDYQAVRWGLARLKPDDRYPAIGTTWTRGSGHFPSSLKYDDCFSEASQLVKQFEKKTEDINEEHLRQSVEKYHEKFLDDKFMKNKEYISWFHGKDLLYHLCKKISPSFPRKRFSEWAVAHIDIKKYPDLQELGTFF